MKHANPETITGEHGGDSAIVGRIRALASQAAERYTDAHTAGDGRPTAEMVVDAILAARYIRMLADMGERSPDPVLDAHATEIDEELAASYADPSERLSTARVEALAIASKEIQIMRLLAGPVVVLVAA